MKGSHHANSEYQYAREDLHGDRCQFRDREGNRTCAGTDGCNRRDGLPDRTRGEEAQSEITTKSRKNAVDLLQADLSSQQSIRQLVENFQHHYTRLHVLVNNAGATFSGWRESVDGLEMMFAVNYLAPFLLTNVLLDVLKASAPARIVNVSSGAQASGSIQTG